MGDCIGVPRSQLLTRWLHCYHSQQEWWPKPQNKTHSLNLTANQQLNKQILYFLHSSVISSIHWNSSDSVTFILITSSLFCPFNVTRVSSSVYTMCARVGLLLKVCAFCVYVRVWKEQAIYSLCIPGDLSLKLHIHDTSLWGLEGHHQIEGLTSAGTHTYTHTENNTGTHSQQQSHPGKHSIHTFQEVLLLFLKEVLFFHTCTLINQWQDREDTSYGRAARVIALYQ